MINKEGLESRLDRILNTMTLRHCKTVSDLTDAEKQLAFYEAVFKLIGVWEDTSDHPSFTGFIETLKKNTTKKIEPGSMKELKCSSVGTMVFFYDE